MTLLLTILIVGTLIFWTLRRFKIFENCPICSATVLTWVIGLFFIYSGRTIDTLIIAILMGATLGAVAEKYGSKYGFLWKAAFVILGFITIYFLVYEELLKAFVSLVLIGLTTLFSNSSSRLRQGKEDKFKDCC